MNQKDLIKYGLLAVAAYLVYRYIQDQGGIGNLFGAAPTGPVDTKSIADAAAAAKAASDTAAAAAAANPTDATLAAKAAAAKAAADAAAAAAAKATADAQAAANAKAAADAAAAKAAADRAASEAAAKTALNITTVSKVAQAAGVSMLNTDQWCYFYQQVTGQACPDPGAIPASTYHDYTGADADRSTPIDINTWWALMQFAQPGISGMGDLITWSRPSINVIPSWLM